MISSSMSCPKSSGKRLELQAELELSLNMV